MHICHFVLQLLHTLVRLLCDADLSKVSSLFTVYINCLLDDHLYILLGHSDDFTVFKNLFTSKPHIDSISHEHFRIQVADSPTDLPHICEIQPVNRRLPGIVRKLLSHCLFE